MDEQTAERLEAYMKEVARLPNESAITHHFRGLVEQLYPGAGIGIAMSRGMEKRVTVHHPAGARRGFIDTHYRNIVIEFEKSLKASRTTAERQLREYVAGLWSEKETRGKPLTAMASDGTRWVTYIPRLANDPEGPCSPDDVVLSPVRDLTLTKHTLREFYMWLTTFLSGTSRKQPTADQFAFDFGAHSEMFAEAQIALETAWTQCGGEPEPALAYSEWMQYLRITYGTIESALEDLFLKHTYLASVSRLLVWTALSEGVTAVSLRETARNVLTGEYFVSRNIANLVEDDFFQWIHLPQAEALLAPVWERCLNEILEYDLSYIGQDVLKGVYQELVDPADRHDLGEYYTPEWLCQMLVSETLPSTGLVAVLDPTCGSGSFLRAAIAHLIAHNRQKGARALLSGILANVAGIDIHPLAVTIARATYALAIRELVKEQSRPIQIPVYLADSLFLPDEVTEPEIQYELEMDDNSNVPCYEIRFGDDKVVHIPEELVKRPEWFDPAIQACAQLAKTRATGAAESESAFRAYINKEASHIASSPNAASIYKALWTFVEELADLIREQKNSIWAYIVRNAYRPAMLRGRFDYILGNPPWLSYRYIAAPGYQEEVKKRALTDYEIAPKEKKLFTHMELATIFLLHALETFGKPGSKIAFVMPRSILSSDHHSKLRDMSYRGDLKITHMHDFFNVMPVFNVPACAVIAVKEPKNSASYNVMPIIEWSGRLASRNEDWQEARQSLNSTSHQAQLVYLGTRTAFSTTGGRTRPSQPSPYAKLFNQGATIVPRNFYFVQFVTLKDKLAPDYLYWADTEPEQAKLAKPPYQNVRLSGQVEGQFVYCTALSKHLLPFCLLDPAHIVLPMDSGTSWDELMDVAAMNEVGLRYFAQWMQKAEKFWSELRGLKAERNTVYEWLDYQGKLTAQSPKQRHLVLYNTSGTHIAAAYVDRSTMEIPFVVESIMYWANVKTATEGHYLAAILNAPSIDKAIKPFQSVGLMGERHIHKKVLDLPIPAYEPKDPRHRRLAELSKTAHKLARNVARETQLPAAIGRQRTEMRAKLGEPITEIDSIVRELLDLA